MSVSKARVPGPVGVHVTAQERAPRQLEDSCMSARLRFSLLVVVLMAGGCPNPDPCRDVRCPAGEACGADGSCATTCGTFESPPDYTACPTGQVCSGTAFWEHPSSLATGCGDLAIITPKTTVRLCESATKCQSNSDCLDLPCMNGVCSLCQSNSDCEWMDCPSPSIGTCVVEQGECVCAQLPADGG